MYGPVSYTHLDVYKRQGAGLSIGKCTGILLQYRTLARQHRLGNKQILRLRQPDVRRNPVSGKQTHLVANHKPVSYTHLDVYKRQADVCRFHGSGIIDAIPIKPTV